MKPPENAVDANGHQISKHSYICPQCGAFSYSEPPHGWDIACPQKLEVDRALIAKLDAEAMHMRRTGGSMEGLVDIMGRIVGEGDE